MQNHFDEIASLLGLMGHRLCEIPEGIKKQVFDIRVRRDGPVVLYGKHTYYLRRNGGVTRAQEDNLYLCSEGELKQLFLRCCDQSVFSHEREISQGYVVALGKYRVGICGTAVLEGERVKTLRDITSMIFRIPREIPGCARQIFCSGVPVEEGLLLVGPPSSGKTTLLKDIIVSLAQGIYGAPRRVVVLDERGELSQSGTADIDFLCGYPKGFGLETAIRMLSPEFLVCDELTDRELKVVKKSVFSGAPLVATVHGRYSSFFERPLCRELLKTGAFHTLVFLKDRSQPATIEKIETVRGLKIYENCRRHSADSQWALIRTAQGEKATEPGNGVA